MSACPGSCNSEWRKVRAIYEDALRKYDIRLSLLADGDPVPDPPPEPRMRPWEGRPVWCGRCQSIIGTELGELDDLASMLAHLPPGIGPAVEDRRDQDVKVTRTATPRSPSPAQDTLDELQRWLLDQEIEWRHHNDWPSPPRRGDLATVRTTVISWLGGDRLPSILAGPFAQDFGEGVREWHRILKRAAHATPSVRFVRQPCPNPPKGCGRYTLWERVGEPYITCVNPDCGRRLTREELELETA